MSVEPTLEDKILEIFDLDPTDEHHKAKEFMMILEIQKRFGFAETNHAILDMIKTRQLLGLGKSDS
jgi:hypothetical protein